MAFYHNPIGLNRGKTERTMTRYRWPSVRSIYFIVVIIAFGVYSLGLLYRTLETTLAPLPMNTMLTAGTQFAVHSGVSPVVLQINQTGTSPANQSSSSEKESHKSDPHQPKPTSAGSKIVAPGPARKPQETHTTVKVYIYSSSRTVWFGNGGPHGEYDENWITLSPKARHHLKCNSSLTLELSLGSSFNKFKENDVVLFNNVEDGLLPKNMQALQKVSKSQGENDQVWIFKALESASYMIWTQGAVKSLPIHAILGYPSTADIQEVYGHYVPGKPAWSPEKPLVEMIQNKSSQAVWIARNCRNTFWPRLDFVQDLMKHMPVDTYGTCGKYTCQPRRSQKCLNLMEKYKFFLALENSECPDYITEKFWNAISHGIVPVVYGPPKESYLKVAPPNSFIHVGDFNNTQELAKYLKYLDENPKVYAEYLKWRQIGSYVHAGANPLPFCGIPEVMRKVKLGFLKKKPMSEFPMYDSCKPQKGRKGFGPGVKYDTWRPW